MEPALYDHPINTATNFWPTKKLSQSLSYFKNTPLKPPQFEGFKVIIWMRFHCPSKKSLETMQKSHLLFQRYIIMIIQQFSWKPLICKIFLCQYSFPFHKVSFLWKFVVKTSYQKEKLIENQLWLFNVCCNLN